jgi:4-hydroxy-3-methylbut-2-en-1-yl diphosphate reductase
MDAEIASYSGYCFGVKRALRMARKTLEEKRAGSKKVYTLGSIIHNPGVVRELSEKGLISASSIEDIEEGSAFVVRSHGISPGVIEELNRKKVTIIDATCPFVKKAQSRTRKLVRDGFHVIVIGDNGHPEVCGIRDQVDSSNIDVIDDMKDLPAIKKRKKIGIVVQTTQTMENLKLLTCGLIDKTEELYLVNTICDTTKNRQDAVRELSGRVDVMLVVGGKNSANTSHLAHISREKNPHTFHIEDSSDIKKEWFKDFRIVGISGGASTPEKDILEIRQKIEDMEF